MIYKKLSVLIAIFFLISCTSIQQNVNNAAKYTDREQIVEVVNKLFVYTDNRNWQGLQTQVFTNDVSFDMLSAGAEKVENLSGKEIADIWQKGLKDVDQIHHQAGNYIVNINGNSADVDAYSIASHYKKDTNNGKIREFIGSYDIGLLNTKEGWRINKFKYNLKYIDGNPTLK